MAATKEELNNMIIKRDIGDIVTYVSVLFKYAVEIGASDIHIEPEDEFLLIRVRKDGDFLIYDKIDREHISAIITRLKVLSKIKIDESKKPQDGKIAYFYEPTKENIDVRLSTLPTSFGEKVVMRILKQDESLVNINALGLIDVNLEKVKETLKTKFGMILAAGPTGSGKSTTLFGLLKNFNPLEYNISTLEDPVEYQMPFVNQSQVKPEIGYTFGTGLRALVRQDPDIIMVGEIRDKETANLGVESALTGHLVFSTIHTNSATGTIQRLINMGVEPFLIASALKMVISQRLGKRICPYCKTEKKLNEYELKKVREILGNIFDKKDLENPVFYYGVGCEKCNNTGYKGRMGFHEVLKLTDSLEPLILNKDTAQDMEKVAIKEGMITIVQDALIKALMGQTTLEEALKLI